MNIPIEMLAVGSRRRRMTDEPIHPLFRRIGRILYKIQFILEDTTGIMFKDMIFKYLNKYYVH